MLKSLQIGTFNRNTLVCLLKYIRVGLLLFALLPTINTSAQDESSDWVLSKEKDDIKVYTRKTGDFKLKEYKVVSTIEASPEELLGAIKNVESYMEWMDNIKFAELLESESKDRFYVYTQVDVPWPFDDRDQITLSEIKRNEENESIVIDVTIVKDYLPEKKGFVRLPSGYGKWAFRSLGNGTSEALHQFVGDPGGKIPAWVANMFIVDGPYKTMYSLKEFIANGKQ